MHKRRIEAAAKRKECLEENMRKAYAVVIGQCNEYIVAKLKRSSDWLVIEGALDLVALLKLLKELMHQFEEHKYEILALHSLLRRFYSYRQGQYTSNEAFLERFKSNADVVDEHRGEIGLTTASIKARLLANGASLSNPWAANNEDLKKAKAEARKEYLAMAMLMAAEHHHCSQLIKELGNDYIKGQDNYPRTIVDAHGMIVNYKTTGRKVPRPDKGSTGLSFTNDGDEDIFVNDGEDTQPRRDKSHIDCWNCGEVGHYANECDKPRKERKGKQAVTQTNIDANTQHQQTEGKVRVSQVNVVEEDEDYQDWDDLLLFLDDVCMSAGGPLNRPDKPTTIGKQVGKVTIGNAVLAQSRRKVVNKNWLLLDSESTVNLISNQRMVTNVQKASDERFVRVHCNGGTKIVSSIADFGSMGEVWFDLSAIANILLFSSGGPKEIPGNL